MNFTHVHVAFDAGTRTLTPVSREADAFFGLVVGTNGTAAIVRREVIEAHYRGALNLTGPLTWRTSSNRAATGLTLVPSSNPWSNNE